MKLAERTSESESSVWSLTEGFVTKKIGGETVLDQVNSLEIVAAAWSALGLISPLFTSLPHQPLAF